MKSQLYTSTLLNQEIGLEFLPFSLKQINTTAVHIGDPWQNLERPSAETSHSLARSLTPALGDNLLQDDKAQGSSLPFLHFFSQRLISHLSISLAHLRRPH